MGSRRNDKSLKVALTRLPAGLFSGLTVMAILWLTLAPKPLGEETPSFFPGADKVAHAIMFGGLVWMLIFDWQRKQRWIPASFWLSINCAALSSIFGCVIEFLQASMGMGRGFEFFDIVADTVGSFLFAFLWLILQKFWTTFH